MPSASASPCWTQILITFQVLRTLAVLRLRAGRHSSLLSLSISSGTYMLILRLIFKSQLSATPQ